jgi:hypothetical protein
MPYGAQALGHEGLRLRSRRVRSDRSHRLSVRFALGLLVVASLAGLLDVIWQMRVSPVADAATSATVEERRYVTTLWSVQSQVDESAAQMGLAAAQFAGGDIDSRELNVRLGDTLAILRRLDDVLSGMQPPEVLSLERQDAIDAIHLFEQSAFEMMKVADDGDPAHVSAGIPMGLEGLSHLRAVSSRLARVQ